MLIICFVYTAPIQCLFPLYVFYSFYISIFMSALPFYHNLLYLYWPYRMLVSWHPRHLFHLIPVAGPDSSSEAENVYTHFNAFRAISMHIKHNAYTSCTVFCSFEFHFFGIFDPVNWTPTRRMMAMDSVERKRGYRTSSFTILSNTSSSSSPGNGD
jgi:hypothetical protein